MLLLDWIKQHLVRNNHYRLLKVRALEGDKICADVSIFSDDFGNQFCILQRWNLFRRTKSSTEHCCYCGRRSGLGGTRLLWEQV